MNAAALTKETEELKIDFCNNVIYESSLTPSTLEKLLINSRKVTKGKIIVILNCSSYINEDYRKLIGMASGILSNYSILVSDYSTQAIMDDIEEGMRSINSNYEKAENMSKAIKRVFQILEKNDLLIVVEKNCQ